MCGERTKEQGQAKNRNKYKTRTNRRTTPHNQTRRQAGGLDDIGGRRIEIKRRLLRLCAIRPFGSSGLWVDFFVIQETPS
jgi:ribonuclease PH